MRFLIEYKDFSTKEEKNRSLSVLDTFLNEHFIGEYHGQTFECIIIRFINNAPKNKKFKLKSLYSTYAEIEIAGHFTDNEKLNIYDFQQGLSKVEEAINMVPEIEIKGNLDFYKDKLLNGIKSCIQFAPHTVEELKKYAQKEKETRYLNTVKRIDCLINSYKMYPQPLKNIIKGVRVFGHFEKESLSPYAYIYSHLFGNLLRRAEVKSPYYTEIFFSIAETMEQAKQSFASETWLKYTYSTLKLSQYIQSDENGKARMVFDSICEGLRFIADFDHLDKEKIEDVIDYIDKSGIDIELTYTSVQNKNYIAEIVYSVPHSHLTKAEFKLRLTDLNNKLTGTVSIDRLDIDYAPYSIGNVQLKENEVVIKGRKSLRAEVSRNIDKLPSEYRFNIQETLKQ